MEVVAYSEKGTPEIYINGRKVNNTKELQHLSSKEVKSVGCHYQSWCTI